MSSYNISLALSSESEAQKILHNVYYEGNTMKVRESDIGNLEGTWGSKINEWKKSWDKGKDENKYIISDDDKNYHKEKGAEEVNSPHKGKQIVQSTGTLIGGAAVATAGIFKNSFVAKGFRNAGNWIGDKTKSVFKGKSGAGSTTHEANGSNPDTGATKPANDGNGNQTNQTEVTDSTKTADSKKADASDIVTVCTAAAVAAKWWIEKPGKEAKDAAEEVKEKVADAGDDSAYAQQAMDKALDDSAEKADKAKEKEEETNDEIKKQQAFLDAFSKSHAELKQKAESKNGLNKREKAEMRELEGYMEEIGGKDGKIVQIYEDGKTTIKDSVDDMETSQSDFDNAAEVAAKTEGLTEAVADWDKTSRNMCYVEAAGQILNGAGATKAAYNLFSKGIIGKIFAAIGFGAAASSAWATKEEFGYASKIDAEIDVREDTESINEATIAQYDEQIDVYDGFVDNVKESADFIPEDVDVTGEKVSNEVQNDKNMNVKINDDNTKVKDDDKDKKK